MTEAPGDQLVIDNTLGLSIKSVTGEPGWTVKVMIGSLISYLAISIVTVNFLFLPVAMALMGLSYGYLLRVMRQCIIDPAAKLPEWNNWVDLLISGISWLAIGMGFTFVGLGLVASALIIGSETGTTKVFDPHFKQWALSSFLLLFALINGGHFFASVLMVNFAEEESMVAGFAWAKVLKRIARQPVLFIAAWLTSLSLSLLAVILPIMTLVFAMMVPFAIFLAQIISARMMAKAWRAAAPTNG